MHAEHQHRGREHHHVVDGERLHGAPRQRHVAVHVGLGDNLTLAVLVRNAPADALVAQAEIAVEAVRRRIEPLVLEMDRLLAHHRVFDIGDDLLPRHRLDVMGVDVADQPVVIFAPDRIALGMGEQVARVGVDIGLLRSEQLRHGSGGCVRCGCPPKHVAGWGDRVIHNPGKTSDLAPPRITRSRRCGPSIRATRDAPALRLVRPAAIP